jgi:hypothetical protein
VAVVSPFVAVVELQSAALSLVAGRIRVRRIIRKAKVEAVQRCVAGASVAGEEGAMSFYGRVAQPCKGGRDPGCALCFIVGSR